MDFTNIKKTLNGSGHDLLNGRPVLKPDDIATPNGTERILINTAITIMRKLKVPLQGFKNVSGLQVPTVDTEAEQELTQFEIRWDRWPIQESHVDKAMHDYALAIKRNLRKNGLMK